MVNDRGSIKWSALMLPEHVEMIKEMWAEDDKKEKPILDEQQINEINMKLQLALHDNLTVEVKYFKDHNFHATKGRIKTIVNSEGIILEGGIKIKFSDVVYVIID